MPNQDLIAIYHAPDFMRASALKAELERCGIPTYIGGEMLRAALGDLPEETSQVHVLKTDLQKALRVCAEFDAQLSPQGPPWTCRTCAEQNPYGFELCWQCGAARADNK